MVFIKLNKLLNLKTLLPLKNVDMEGITDDILQYELNKSCIFINNISCYNADSILLDEFGIIRVLPKYEHLSVELALSAIVRYGLDYNISFSEESIKRDYGNSYYPDDLIKYINAGVNIL